MPDPGSSSRVSASISASREAIYRAFTEPAALEAWQAPGEMTGIVHDFDLREGGGYDMSLYYPADDAGAGKTSASEDRFTTRFLSLEPPARIVQAVTFDTTDPNFGGEMMMTVTLAEAGPGTEVTIAYANVPPGISPEDNAAGSRDSLRKLAAYVRSAGRS